MSNDTKLSARQEALAGELAKEGHSMDEALQMARDAGDPPKPSRDLLDILMQVYADAVNNGDGYLGRAQLEYTLMKHDLCLIDARDCPSPSVSRPNLESEAK